jgi:hypothetical protein
MDVPETSRPGKPPAYGIVDNGGGVTDVVLAAMAGQVGIRACATGDVAWGD